MRTDAAELRNRFVQCRALKFGDFVLKSGTRSKYFFDLSAFSSNKDLEFIGEAYALALLEWMEKNDQEIDVLYGPAYKGIAAVLATAHGFDKHCMDGIDWCFNRKEVKGHGEGGILVGAPVRGRRIMIVDDVLSSGTSAKESVKILQDEGAYVLGLIVALDRQEHSETERLKLEKELGLDYPVISLIDYESLVVSYE